MIEGIVASLIASVWLASIEYRIRSLDMRFRTTPTKKEVTEEIKLRNEPTRVLLQEIKEDISYLRKQQEKTDKCP